MTGDAYLCFGRLALLSPINPNHLIPSFNVPVPTPWQDEPRGADRPMTTVTGTQSDLFVWAKDSSGKISASPRSTPSGCVIAGSSCSRPTPARASTRPSTGEGQSWREKAPSPGMSLDRRAFPLRVSLSPETGVSAPFLSAAKLQPLSLAQGSVQRPNKSRPGGSHRPTPLSRRRRQCPRDV